MYTHILLAVSGSESSLRAAAHGIALARALAAKVTAVIVTTPWVTQFTCESAVLVPEVIVPPNEYDLKADAAACTTLRIVVEAAQEAQVTCRVLHVRHGEPAQAILEVATRERCDLIVLGSGARHRAAPGSETIRVLSRSRMPVLVYA